MYLSSKAHINLPRIIPQGNYWGKFEMVTHVALMLNFVPDGWLSDVDDLSSPLFMCDEEDLNIAVFS